MAQEQIKISKTTTIDEIKIPVIEGQSVTFIVDKGQMAIILPIPPDNAEDQPELREQLKKQTAALFELQNRANSDPNKCAAILNELKAAAASPPSSDRELLPPLREAEAPVTLGKDGGVSTLKMNIDGQEVILRGMLNEDGNKFAIENVDVKNSGKVGSIEPKITIDVRKTGTDDSPVFTVDPAVIKKLGINSDLQTTVAKMTGKPVPTPETEQAPPSRETGVAMSPKEAAIEAYIYTLEKEGLKVDDKNKAEIRKNLQNKDLEAIDKGTKAVTDYIKAWKERLKREIKRNPNEKDPDYDERIKELLDGRMETEKKDPTSMAFKVKNGVLNQEEIVKETVAMGGTPGAETGGEKKNWFERNMGKLIGGGIGLLLGSLLSSVLGPIGLLIGAVLGIAGGHALVDSKQDGAGHDVTQAGPNAPGVVKQRQQASGHTAPQQGHGPQRQVLGQAPQQQQGGIQWGRVQQGQQALSMDLDKESKHAAGQVANALLSNNGKAAAKALNDYDQVLDQQIHKLSKNPNPNVRVLAHKLEETRKVHEAAAARLANMSSQDVNNLLKQPIVAHDGKQHTIGKMLQNPAQRLEAAAFIVKQEANEGMNVARTKAGQHHGENGIGGVQQANRGQDKTPIPAPGTAPGQGAGMAQA